MRKRAKRDQNIYAWDLGREKRGRRQKRGGLEVTFSLGGSAASPRREDKAKKSRFECPEGEGGDPRSSLNQGHKLEQLPGKEGSRHLPFFGRMKLEKENSIVSNPRLSNLGRNPSAPVRCPLARRRGKKKAAPCSPYLRYRGRKRREGRKGEGNKSRLPSWFGSPKGRGELSFGGKKKKKGRPYISVFLRLSVEYWEGEEGRGRLLPSRTEEQTNRNEGAKAHSLLRPQHVGNEQRRNGEWTRS